MAGWFGDCNSVLIESLRDKAKEKAKLRASYRLAASWVKKKGHEEKNIESYETGELNNVFEQFYATVRKQDGKEYKPDSLRVMATAIDRHVKERENQTFHAESETDSFQNQNESSRGKQSGSEKASK